MGNSKSRSTIPEFGITLRQQLSRNGRCTSSASMGPLEIRGLEYLCEISHLFGCFGSFEHVQHPFALCIAIASRRLVEVNNTAPIPHNSNAPSAGPVRLTMDAGANRKV